jgi:hypothetical protein
MKDEGGKAKLIQFILPPSSFILAFGEVQEWLNWQHWKCCERETVPWVRIPPSPPVHLI